ncbi:MAG: hypothetical protein ACI8XZ_003956 [Gammaproteobacteria bacterium]|jgi:hypothetical protein
MFTDTIGGPVLCWCRRTSCDHETSDPLTYGRRLCTFRVVDNFNPEAPYIEVDNSITSFQLNRAFRQLGIQ